MLPHLHFGFVALLGVIALISMIMRDSVIPIDQIEQDRKRAVTAWTAIVEVAVWRFRPITRSAATAVLAMIFLSRSVFLGPIAIVIMDGLIVATEPTLLAPAGHVCGLVPGRGANGLMPGCRLSRSRLDGCAIDMIASIMNLTVMLDFAFIQGLAAKIKAGMNGVYFPSAPTHGVGQTSAATSTLR